MKTYTTYGSCQADALAKILNAVPRFAAEWQYIKIPACFDMTVAELDMHSQRTFKDIDLFIYQPVSEHHRGVEFSTEHLRTNVVETSNILSFQYLHWEGYSPTFNSPYGLPAHPLGYVDSLAALAVSNGVSLEMFLSKLVEIKESLDLKTTSIESWSLDQLSQREDGDSDGYRSIDVVATEHIKNNWKASHLFYTMNHPSKHTLWEIARQMLERLGYSTSDIQVEALPDPLSATILPTQCGVDFDSKYGLTDEGLIARALNVDRIQASFYNKQFSWFSRQKPEQVLDFISRLTISRPWIAEVYSEVFEG